MKKQRDHMLREKQRNGTQKARTFFMPELKLRPPEERAIVRYARERVTPRSERRVGAFEE